MVSTTGGSSITYSRDRASLAEFLLNTRTILNLFVDYREVLLPGYMRNEFLEAWPHVESTINGVVRMMQEEASESEIEYYSQGSFHTIGELDGLLEFYGLSGVQLQLKLASFYHTYNQLMQPPDMAQVITGQYDRQRNPNAPKQKSRFMRWLLPKINSILGSLARAVPGVDIVKEFKEMSEYGCEEAQSDGLPF